MIIYKIFRQAEWDALCAEGTTQGAPIDLTDGFIHFSTAKQVVETAAKHFANETDLVLAQIDSAPLGDALRWEPSRGGDLFPHLYRALSKSEVRRHDALLLGEDGRHVFPALVS